MSSETPEKPDSFGFSVFMFMAGAVVFMITSIQLHDRLAARIDRLDQQIRELQAPESQTRELQAPRTQPSTSAPPASRPIAEQPQP